jgi:RNA polymerase sigma factor (sigma-70 family)
VSNNYEKINKLIHSYKNGDQEVIFDLYEYYRPLLLASVKRCLIKDKKLIPYKEDIVEDCFLVFEKLLEQYDENLTYFSYFLSTRIDINLFRYVSDKYKPIEFIEDDHISNNCFYDPFNTIDNIISIQSALEKLNSKQKEAIDLYFFQGMEQIEASMYLNITQSSFSKRLQRGLAKLKEILGDDFLI